LTPPKSSPKNLDRTPLAPGRFLGDKPAPDKAKHTQG